MTDEHVQSDESTQPESDDAPESPPQSSLKETLRGGAAKAVGFAVEVGSILGGESGQIVEAEREMAEAGTEEFIDRIDGEG